MRYAVKVEYFSGNCSTVERILPEGWEPMGGDIEDGNALRLVMARRLTETEEAAVEEAGRKAESKPKRTRKKA